MLFAERQSQYAKRIQPGAKPPIVAKPIFSYSTRGEKAAQSHFGIARVVVLEA